MFPLRICLLLFLLPSYIAAYPVEAEVKSDQCSDHDPADYPDLTHGLSDADVESTLNGLSLDDLGSLNKLLDDAGTGPFDIEASLRDHHRQAKKQHHEDVETVDEDLEPSLNSGRQTFDDGCHDEDDDEKKDQCTEQPKCKKRPSTKRCSSTTRRCHTTSCKSLDGFLDIQLDNNKYDSKLNYKGADECDPGDTMCLQRCQQRSKQRPSMHDFSDITMNQAPGNIDSLEHMAAEAQRDESLKLHKQGDGWIGKDYALPDVVNNDDSQLSDANLNDFKELPKLGNSWAEAKVAEDEGLAQQNDEEPKLQEPYERHQLARVAHEQAQLEEQSEQAEDYMQSNAASAADPGASQEELEAAEPLPLTNDVAANDGDSFIAKNARDPQRYLIQTEDGYIKSENEPGEHQLRSDKQQSEMLNYDNYQLSNERNLGQNQLQSKRIKRDSRKTDDAPVNTNESYLKKLMDSFPRDQGSQSNLNVAIRQAKLAHLRVKRS